MNYSVRNLFAMGIACVGLMATLGQRAGGRCR